MVKQIKDAGMHYEKLVTDADLQLEKSKQKFENTNEEWGRAVSQRNQEPTQTPKKNLFRSSRTPAQVSVYAESAHSVLYWHLSVAG